MRPMGCSREHKIPSSRIAASTRIGFVDPQVNRGGRRFANSELGQDLIIAADGDSYDLAIR